MGDMRAADGQAVTVGTTSVVLDDDGLPIGVESTETSGVFVVPSAMRDDDDDSSERE